MPFINSHIDPERGLPPDARSHFESLSRTIVKEPLSTSIIRTQSPTGRIRYLIVDRAVQPEEGDLIVVAADYRFKVGRYANSIPLSKVWGTVVWFLQEGRG